MDWCTVQCEILLFCTKRVVKELCNFKLTHLKKKNKKKEEHFGHLVTSWFGTSAKLFRVTIALVMKELKDEWNIVRNAYKLRDFLYYHILCVHVIPTQRVYRHNH